jgi:TonB family protein
MAMKPHRALKAIPGLVISISVRNQFCFGVTLLAAFVVINANAADVIYTPPIPIETKEAVYPVDSVARGSVVVVVVVEQDGLVSKAEVIKSVNSLDEPSVYAAKQWRFEPARLDGQPIRSGASISFVYDRGLFPPTKPKKTARVALSRDQSGRAELPGLQIGP